jgi:hypothetical protein
VLGTAELLSQAAAWGIGPSRKLLGRAFPDPTDEPAADHGPVAGTPPTASTMALREARWRGARWVADDAPPSWSAPVEVALNHALGQARSRGLAYVNGTHLMLGLLADRANAASRVLADAGINRRDLVNGLRRSSDANRPGEPWTPLVETFEVFGAVPAGDLLTRTIALPIGLVLRRRGYGHPLLPAFRQEISRQAVLLGDTDITTAHLVLALAHADIQLAAAGRAVPDVVAGWHTAGAVLARHGLRYGQAIRQMSAASAAPAASSGEVFEPASADAARGVWPSLRAGDPRWGRRVLELLTEARADAARRGHRATGTTHLLAAALMDPAAAASSLLRALGVDVEGVRADLERDLSESRP